jgi:hypothetical protein
VLAAVVAHLRQADENEAAAVAADRYARPTPSPSRPAWPSAGSTGTSDPANALLLLREAAATRRGIWVEMVGPTGALQRRLLRPVRVDGGRLRALDPARQAELTVAVHRIVSVSWPDEAADPDRIATIEEVR